MVAALIAYITPAMLLLEAKKLVRGSFVGRSVTESEFRAHFGVSPRVGSRLWSLCHPDIPTGAAIKHLLWSLMFLKVYQSIAILCNKAGVSPNTWCQWSWLFVEIIACQKSKVIKWESRLLRNDKGCTCKVMVDGTDFAIGEPYPFDKKWYSHKFKGPGLRYEVGVCIQTGDIVWTYGPFPCGRFPDIKIFRHRLINLLPPGEKVEADAGYRGERAKIRVPADYLNEADRRAKAGARARHETVNKQFKQWGCLGKKFRHPLSKHMMCFNAVAVSYPTHD
jgi:hypothetical protein